MKIKRYSINKIIRKIMRFINRHYILWKLFIKFNWYKKLINKQAYSVLEEMERGNEV